MYDSMVDFLSEVLKYGIPLLIVALAGMFTERGGVTNIALEGIMIIGAFCGIATLNLFDPSFAEGSAILFFLGMGAAVLGGTLFSYLHAVASIKMRADQIISATALNTLAPALVLFLTMELGIGEYSPGSGGTSDNLEIAASQFVIREVPLLSKIPFIGDVFFKDIYPNFYVGILLLVLAYIFIYKTRFGLRLRACGENPHAADAAGVNIFKMRYAGVLISGALAGLGGFLLVISTTILFDATVSSFGFLAIAVMIFGNWKPYHIALSALFFSFFVVMSKWTWGSNVETWISGVPGLSLLIKILPYLATMIVLVLSSRNSQSPKASGKIFEKGER